MKYIITTDSFPRSIVRDPFNNRLLVGREGRKESHRRSSIDHRRESIELYQLHDSPQRFL